jgi:hypothetical protein
MLRSAASTIAIFTLVTGVAFAQGNGRNSARNQGIPPGQMPPAGQCRVWYEGRPPGQQPRATNCNEAERIASRSNSARVIYGSGTYGRDDRSGRDDRYGRDDPYGRDDRAGRNGSYARISAAYNQGRNDGVTKAREDMRDGDRYDPARHGWYKSGDRGYNSRYGSRADYRDDYRAGFVDGYDNTYRDNRNTTDRDDNGRDGVSIWDRITQRRN